MRNLRVVLIVIAFVIVMLALVGTMGLLRDVSSVKEKPSPVVIKLFTLEDGCSAFKFYDSRRWHYFMKCKEGEFEWERRP